MLNKMLENIAKDMLDKLPENMRKDILEGILNKK